MFWLNEPPSLADLRGWAFVLLIPEQQNQYNAKMEIVAGKQAIKKIIVSLSAEVLVPYLRKPRSLVLTLSGPLGAGKTQTVKWLARSLGIRRPLRSPTFTLWQNYPFVIGRRHYTLHHLDLYRLDQPREIFKLSLRATLRQPGNIVVIEWGERIHRWLPKPFLNLTLERLDPVRRGTSPTKRRLIFTHHGQ